MAAERVNAAGGVLGRPLRLAFYDQGAPPHTLVQDMRRDNVFAAAGFDSSDPVLAAIPAIMNDKMLLMVTGAGSPAITAAVARDPKTYRTLFRNGNDAIGWVTPATHFLKDILEARKFFYLAQRNQFGQDMESALVEAMAPFGIRSVGSYFFARGTRMDRDAEVLAETLRLIEAAKPDVVVSYLGPTAFSFLKSYRAERIPVPVFDLAANGVEMEDRVKEELGSDADYVALSVGALDVDLSPHTRTFFQAYRSRTGRNPGGLFDVRAGDGITILAEAIQKAGILDTEEVVKVLETGRFTGVGGRYEFDANHQARFGPGYLTGVIAQWQNGKLEVIWPEAYRTAKFARASWWRVP